MKLFFSTAAAVVALTVAVPAMAQTTVGSSDSGNCYPFSCGPTDGVTQYQQAFRGGAFSGAQAFNTLSYNIFTGYVPGTNLDQGTYALSFYYSANPVAGLSNNLSSNLGAFIGNFGSFTLNGAAPNVLSLTGSTINYNPALGDLLLNAVITGASSYNGSYNVFYNSDQTGVDTARAYTSTYEDYAGTGALVTTFSLVSSVPEPATWAMMIVGFGMVGFAMRRRNKVQARVRYV